MNALWLLLTSEDRCGANLVANTFVTSFPTLCMRLIGL
jgi:hypothetical protein